MIIFELRVYIAQGCLQAIAHSDCAIISQIPKSFLKTQKIAIYFEISGYP